MFGGLHFFSSYLTTYIFMPVGGVSSETKVPSSKLSAMRTRSDGSDNDITKDECGKLLATKKGSSLPRDAELRSRAESARPASRDEQMEFVSLIVVFVYFVSPRMHDWIDKIWTYIRHVRPPRLRGFPHFLFPNFAFFSCDSAFFTRPDLARIIELSSAQLDCTEIANFAPVSWARNSEVKRN